MSDMSNYNNACIIDVKNVEIKIKKFKKVKNVTRIF